MKVSKPKVSPIAEGQKNKTKRMEGNAGELLPKHIASLESVLVVTHGECYLHIDDEKQNLKQGDSYIIPASVTHQIEVVEDLKAIHIMPHGIKFEFFK